MRVGVISDLHVDRNQDLLRQGSTFASLLSDSLIDKEVDYVLIAGDLSNHYQQSQAFLESVQQRAGIPAKFVPGNHDYWAKDHGWVNTNEVDRFFKEQKESVVGQPFLLNEDWALVGSPGWYDYGYGNHEIYTLQDFEKKQYKFASWNDRHYVDWQASDQEVSQRMLEQLRTDLNQVKEKNIILMTHVATHKEFVVPLPHRVYDYANAFLGAKSYEMLYKEFPNIQYSIMGHVHFRKMFKENGITYLSACLGNKKHWRIKDARYQLEKTLVVLDI